MIPAITTLTTLSALLLLATPTEGAAPDGGSDSWRNTRPVAGPEPVFSPPQVQTFRINGTKLDVFLVERHQLPIVNLSLVVDLGRVADPKGKSGLGGLCMDLMDEGTVSLDKNAFEGKKADIAASLSAQNSNETAGLDLAVTKGKLDAGMALFADVLLHPGLRRSDLERLRARHLASLKQARASAESVGARVTPHVWWGEGHPFGAVATEASLGAITEKDCASLAARLLPDGARLFVAGDVTPTELQALFAKHLAQWRGMAPSAVKTTDAKSLAGRYFFVDVPGAAQSRVAVVQSAPGRTDKAYADNAVLAAIYGGGFSSRINMNLREKNGYTYGARGGFGYPRRGGMLSTTSSVRTDVTLPALREIAAELSSISGGKITDVELVRERQGALLAYPAQFATGNSTLGAASELAFYGLPFGEWTSLPQRLRAVDAAAVEQAAKRIVRPKDSVVVVAGDAKVVRPALEALAKEELFGPGAVVELDADGNVKK